MTLENLLEKLRAEVAKGRPKFDEHDSLFDTGVAAGRYELAEELLTRFDAPRLELKPGDWYVDTDDYQAITEVDSSDIRRHYIDGGFLALNADAGWPSRRMTPEEIQAFKTDGTFPTNNER